MPKGTESNSISHQRQLMMEYVSGHPDLQGYRIAEFVDDGFSGADFTRPNFQKMMGQVKAGDIGVNHHQRLQQAWEGLSGSGKLYGMYFPADAGAVYLCE
ncbi:MAG: recombinase family protein [Clostridiales bacterium]|nr:recombinase family protein [Clostridiales bacterium]